MSADISDMLESNQKRMSKEEEKSDLVEAVNSSKLDHVLIDALAVLKIIQHAESSKSKSSSGFLFGTDFNEELQITDAYKDIEYETSHFPSPLSPLSLDLTSIFFF